MYPLSCDIKDLQYLQLLSQLWNCTNVILARSTNSTELINETDAPACSILRYQFAVLLLKGQDGDQLPQIIVLKTYFKS